MEATAATAAPRRFLTLVLLLTLLAPASAAPALKLPDYIKPCSRNDPKLNECALKHAMPAIPFLLKGVPKFNVPVLTPLKVSQIKVDGGEGSVGLHITINDANFFGFKEAVIKDINFDLPKKQAELKASVPVGQLLGQYEVGGKILLLPITGKGNANVTLVDLELTFTVHWELEKRDDGKEYIKPVSSDIKYDMSRAYVQLDGLFGGDKTLGDNMNQFLNENWRDVVKEIGPAVAEALAAVLTQILSGITHLVPYDDVFPETV